MILPPCPIGVRSEFSREGGGGGQNQTRGKVREGDVPLPREARKLSVLFSFISIDHAVISMNINLFGYARGGQMPPLAPMSGHLWLPLHLGHDLASLPLDLGHNLASLPLDLGRLLASLPLDLGHDLASLPLDLGHDLPSLPLDLGRLLAPRSWPRSCLLAPIDLGSLLAPRSWP